MGKPVKIGINGFGRIGRKVLRLALQRDDVEVVGINDLGDIATLAHLLKYDSVHGVLSQNVQIEGNRLKVGDQTISIFSDRDPAQVPWGEVNAEIVHECTGLFRDQASAGKHLKDSVKKVIISAPGKDADWTVCIGVNHETYDPKAHRIISNASCTTNCLAPVVKVLDEAFGIECGTMTTVHSYTNDQKILDLPHSDLRRARAGAVSQIPTSTGAAKAVGLVLPHLKGKLDGFAVRVPTPNVSLVDFVGVVKKETTAEAVNAAFEEAAQGPLEGILAVEKTPLVSCDYNGNTASSTVDHELTKVQGGRLVKVIAWYDNESGFSQRMLDLSQFIATQGF